MANSVFTTFLVLLSFFQMCYSSSRPIPDDATVVIFFTLDDQDFQKKEQDFIQKLREALPQLRFEEGDFITATFARLKFYKVQFAATLSPKVETIAKKLDIKGSTVIAPNLRQVTVTYTFPSEEHEFLEKLKKADIPVIRSEEWLKTTPISIDVLTYPRDQEYYVAASLKSETEEIARGVGILKTII